MPEPSGDEPSGARLSARRKQAEFQRANGCCEYCRSQVHYSPNPFSVEHIMPHAGGGTDRPDNLALSCQGCNNCKYTSVDATDPVTGATVPLFHPRRQRWDEHFAWNGDFTLVIGRTPMGRATVEKLQLNRGGVVNLRHVLRVVGEHPPTEPAEPNASPQTDGVEERAPE